LGIHSNGAGTIPEIRVENKATGLCPSFPQAPVERECYMHIPRGIVMGDSGNWVLRVKKNIYEQKQAGRVWNEQLVKKLTSPAVGFVQSKYDECIFFHKHAVYVLYTDDSILAGPDKSELDRFIASVKSVGLDIIEEGELEDFWGINIDKIGENEYHHSQPQLID
jgi:hypothetical protein